MNVNVTFQPGDEAERPPDVKSLALHYLMYKIGKSYFNKYSKCFPEEVIKVGKFKSLLDILPTIYLY